jgi:putative oxidoreductase
MRVQAAGFEMATAKKLNTAARRQEETCAQDYSCGETRMNTVLNFVGRLLLAQLFLLAGLSKITGYAAAQGYMASKGLPGALLPLVILLELGGGLALVAGFQTRWVALALAIFSVLVGFIFHLVPGDQGQMISFMKNLSIAGGLLIVAQTGATGLAIDTRARATQT